MKVSFITINIKDSDLKNIKLVIRKVLKLGFSELVEDQFENNEISVLLTNNLKIRDLNYKYRKIWKETNVLSFPQCVSLKRSKYEKIYLWGDIVLSIEKIMEESLIQSKSFNDHLSHIVLHGFMHLIGYDHDSKTKAKLMEKKEITLLSKLSIKDPYMMNLLS